MILQRDAARMAKIDKPIAQKVVLMHGKKLSPIVLAPNYGQRFVDSYSSFSFLNFLKEHFPQED